MRNLLSSVGIIGGADGPTAIFVTSSPDWPLYAVCMTAVIIAAALIIRRRMKK